LFHARPAGEVQVELHQDFWRPSLVCADRAHDGIADRSCLRNPPVAGQCSRSSPALSARVEEPPLKRLRHHTLPATEAITRIAMSASSDSMVVTSRQEWGRRAR
jgi:hypothetical protein